MWKKIALVAVTGACAIGAGTAAVAATAPTPTPGTQTPGAHSSTHANSGHKGKHDPLRRAAHAQWVTHSIKTGANTTHDAIRGAVTAVSPGSIVVKAADGTSETYAVTSSTKVRVHGQAKGATGQISQVKSGDTVIVTGTGTSSLSAGRIIDHGVVAAKAAPAPSSSPTS